MNIVEALKLLEYNLVLKVDNGHKWLYWDRGSQAWIVRGKSGPGRNIVLIETESEQEAVKKLLE